MSGYDHIYAWGVEDGFYLHMFDRERGSLNLADSDTEVFIKLSKKDRKRLIKALKKAAK